MTTMTKKLVQRDKILGFTVLCGFLYFTSYIARLNFGAAMADIMMTRGFAKTQLGWVSTAGFVTYGLGQFLFGCLGDRVNPRNLIFWGMIATAVCNLALPFAPTAGVMVLIWAINGFAQSSLWPPLIRMMSERCTRDRFSGACVQVSAASSLGTVVVYLFVPFCIIKASWEAVFFVSAVCSLIAAAVWYFGAGYFVRYAENNGVYEQEQHTQRKAQDGNSLRGLMMSSGLMVAIGAIVLQGILRDGVITWTPTYLTEVFGVDSSLSILSSVVLPVFAVVSVTFASYVNRRFFHNEMACAAALFIAGTAAAVLLRIFFSASVVVSVVLAALVTAAMHGINLMLISCVPGRFDRWGKVSTVSGILNAFAYLGSASSAYGIAYVAQNYGWDTTIALWAAVAFGGGVLCIAVVKRWKRFIR